MAPLGAEASPAPRVASLNLCADEILLLLAPAGAIASLSPVGHDWRISPVAGAAAAFADNRGSAEAIVAERADLVLADAFSAGSARELLRRSRIRVEQIALVDRPEDAAAEIRRIGALIAEPARAEGAAATMDRALAAVPAPGRGRRALFLEPNGWSPGSNTIEDAVLRRLGFRNAAAELGIRFDAPVGLEALVRNPPDVILLDRYGVTASRAETALDTPLLRALPSVVLDWPATAFSCPTPSLTEAVARLAALVARNAP